MLMSEPILRRINPDQIPSIRRKPVDSETMRLAREIVESVRQGSEQVLLAHAVRFGDLVEGEKFLFSPDDFAKALKSIPSDQRRLLERTAGRIRGFAEAQRASLQPMNLEIPGGTAGHTIEPMERAGCYVPGGRYPLLSTVLMTVIPARVAGVKEVWVASPKPQPLTLAAASIAGASAMIAVGGAQAIAALAYGAGDQIPACDIVVGPGNRWVTAAKIIISGEIAIDLPGGPSELVVLADGSADADTIASDLLAQAEHDPDALPILVCTDAKMIEAIEEALREQLLTLPTAEIAREALKNGFAVLVPDARAGIEVCNAIAPEHLQLCIESTEGLTERIKHCGALFLGEGGAEVLGDYGAGPNHVLPTGGAARSFGGLSVFQFMRVRTWLRFERREDAHEIASDAAAFARLEGLEAHARAAERRMENE